MIDNIVVNERVLIRLNHNEYQIGSRHRNIYQYIMINNNIQWLDWLTKKGRIEDKE